ncbi:MAG: hypothetical protein Q9195_002984 [Heterodermia aff. obscurata]
MAAPLSIRNLTVKPFELKVLERFEHLATVDSGQGLQNITNLTKNFTSLFSNSTSSKPPQISDDAKSFSHEEVSIRIEPLKSLKTDIKPAQPPIHMLRLTFEVDGERHRVDTPSHKDDSIVLTPMTPNPQNSYTAIYLPQCSQLTLFSSANLPSWMRKFKDSTPLSALSIPGTHNSPTCHKALPSVRCQATSPPEQLDNGIRFFDIRVQPENPGDPSNDKLVLVHAVFPISLTGAKYFRDLLKEVYTFLDRNPSETLIMSLKREGTGPATDQQLSRILHDHYYAPDPTRWFTAARIPTLGEARGKVVLIRRFALDDSLNSSGGWGIDAATWADNTPNATCPSGDICVQDFYEVLETENIEKKIQYSEAHLERAAACVCAFDNPAAATAVVQKKQPFFINFLTASNFWKVGCWPDRIAAKLNPAIVEHLCVRHNAGEEGGGDGGTGIVVCDWVGLRGDWDLVRCVVGMNARLEIREGVD